MQGHSPINHTPTHNQDRADIIAIAEAVMRVAERIGADDISKWLVAEIDTNRVNADFEAMLAQLNGGGSS